VSWEERVADDVDACMQWMQATAGDPVLDRILLQPKSE